MLSILNAELFRLKKSKLFWIMFGLCIALPILSLLLVLGLTGLIEALINSLEELDTANTNITEMLRAMDLTNMELQGLSSLSNTSAFLALICTGVVLSKEFSDGTMRNVILANKSRKQMYFAYLLTAMIVGSMYLLAYFATIMILFAPIYGFGQSSAGQAASSVFCSLALGLLSMAFVESCVCMFLFCVRKQWATILFPILICLVAPGVLTTIVTIVSAVLLFNGHTISDAMMSWIPLVNAQLYQAGNIDGGLVGKIALYYALFTGGFIALGYFTFEKSDLK